MVSCCWRPKPLREALRKMGAENATLKSLVSKVNAKDWEGRAGLQSCIGLDGAMA